MPFRAGTCYLTILALLPKFLRQTYAVILYSHQDVVSPVADVEHYILGVCVRATLQVPALALPIPRGGGELPPVRYLPVIVAKSVDCARIARQSGAVPAWRMR